MFRFVAVLFIAAISFQASAAAVEDEIHDGVLKSLEQYFLDLPQKIDKAWQQYSHQVVRMTGVGESLNLWGRELANTLASGDCVDNLRAVYINLKNNAIQVYHNCSNSLPPISTEQLQRDINNVIASLKETDAQIQKEQESCKNVNEWRKIMCDIEVRARAFSHRMKVQANALAIYNEVRNMITQRGDKLAKCLAQSTTSIVDQLNRDMAQIQQCENN